MGRPFGVRDSKPRMYQGKLRSKDNESYNLSDSGSREATDYLKHQSLCLECPFPECLLDKLKKSGPRVGVKYG